MEQQVEMLASQMSTLLAGQEQMQAQLALLVQSISELRSGAAAAAAAAAFSGVDRSSASRNPRALAAQEHSPPPRGSAARAPGRGGWRVPVAASAFAAAAGLRVSELGQGAAAFGRPPVSSGAGLNNVRTCGIALDPQAEFLTLKRNPQVRIISATNSANITPAGSRAVSATNIPRLGLAGGPAAGDESLRRRQLRGSGGSADGEAVAGRKVGVARKGVAWAEEDAVVEPATTPPWKSTDKQGAGSGREGGLVLEGDEDDDPNQVNIASATAAMRARGGPDPNLPPWIAWPKYILWDVLDHPEPLRTWWLLAMIGLMLYVIIVTPYLIAYEISTADLETPIACIDLSVSCAFMADIWVNLRTSFLDAKGRFVRDRTRISRAYLRYWFWIDGVSAVPWDLVLGPHFGLLRLLRVGKSQRLMKILSVVRVLRMLRVLHAKSVVQQLEEALGRYVSRMLFFSALALTLVHWSACAFYYMSQLRNFQSDTWVAVQGLAEAPYFRRYVASIYWAFTTMATVGYGDIVAISVIERVCAMCIMVVGASMFAYLIGSVASLLADMNYTQGKIDRKLTVVEAFLNHRRIPLVLGKKVRSYYHYVAHQVLDDEQDILVGLSHSLRSQVILHMYKGVLEKVDFFRGKHARFITAVCQLLRPEFYSPGDVVIFQGDVSAEMYFVIQGVLEARVYDPDSLARLRHTEGMDTGLQPLPSPDDEQEAYTGAAAQSSEPAADGGGGLVGAASVQRSAISMAVRRVRGMSNPASSNGVAPAAEPLQPAGSLQCAGQDAARTSRAPAALHDDLGSVGTGSNAAAVTGAPGAAVAESEEQQEPWSGQPQGGEQMNQPLQSSVDVYSGHVADRASHSRNKVVPQPVTGVPSVTASAYSAAARQPNPNPFGKEDVDGRGSDRRASNAVHSSHGHEDSAAMGGAVGAGGPAGRPQPQVQQQWRNRRGGLLSRVKGLLGLEVAAQEEETYSYDVVGMLVGGTHFGETTGLLGVPRTVTVVAVEHSELYSLARTDLEDVVSLWPDIKAELDALCQAYLQQVREDSEAAAQEAAAAAGHQLSTEAGGGADGSQQGGGASRKGSVGDEGGEGEGGTRGPSRAASMKPSATPHMSGDASFYVARRHLGAGGGGVMTALMQARGSAQSAASGGEGEGESEGEVLRGHSSASQLGPGRQPSHPGTARAPHEHRTVTAHTAAHVPNPHPGLGFAVLFTDAAKV